MVGKKLFTHTMNDQHGGKGRLALGTIIMLLGISLAYVGYGKPGKALQAQDIRENIHDSAIISTNDYLMVGDRGKIFRSVDSGKTWQEAVSGTRLPLYSVTFPDSMNGWIVGKSGLILHTSDGGENWSEQKSETGKHLFSIDFVNEQCGCAVGDWGTIVATEDGGVTWRDVSLSEDVVLYGVAFVDRQNGWIVGEFGQVFKTHDGGKNWAPVQLSTPVNTSLFCLSLDENSFYAAGLDGVIIYSKDRGETWHHAQSDTDKALYTIAIRGDSGWAAGDAGTILHTTDGGQSWVLTDIPEENKLFWVGTVSLANNNPEHNRGFGAGASGLFFTIKEGNLLWKVGDKRS